MEINICNNNYKCHHYSGKDIIYPSTILDIKNNASVFPNFKEQYKFMIKYTCIRTSTLDDFICCEKYGKTFEECYDYIIDTFGNFLEGLKKNIIYNDMNVLKNKENVHNIDSYDSSFFVNTLDKAKESGVVLTTPDFGIIYSFNIIETPDDNIFDVQMKNYVSCNELYYCNIHYFATNKFYKEIVEIRGLEDCVLCEEKNTGKFKDYRANHDKRFEKMELRVAVEKYFECIDIKFSHDEMEKILDFIEKGMVCNELLKINLNNSDESMINERLIIVKSTSNCTDENR